MSLNPGDAGVDLASYQHPGGSAIDYRQLAQACRFAYVQLTDGTTYLNPYGVTDARGCQGAGMETGAYLFWRPDDSFNEQVNDFVKYYLAVGGFTLPPMIDCETESANGWVWTANQLGLLQRNLVTALGVDVGVYLNDSFYASMPGCPWGWPLWLADPSHPTAPTFPCTLQQTGTGSVPGIAAQTDLDTWRGHSPTPPKPPQEDDMGVSAPIESTGQTNVFQVKNTKLWHKWRLDGQDNWGNEDVGALAGPSSGANFPDQEPKVTVSGTLIRVTVEDSSGHVWYFAQNAGPWGTNELP